MGGERKGQTEVETGDKNVHNHLFQEHFLRTFPNEGPGSVNLSLIRKQSLPKEVLGTGEVLKEMQKEARELEASLHEFHYAPSSLHPSFLLPVFFLVSELILNSKTKVPSQVAKNSSQIQQSTH